MTDLNFRSWSRRLTIGISLVYLSRGLWRLAFPE